MKESKFIKMIQLKSIIDDALFELMWNKWVLANGKHDLLMPMEHWRARQFLKEHRWKIK